MSLFFFFFVNTEVLGGGGGPPWLFLTTTSDLLLTSVDSCCYKSMLLENRTKTPSWIWNIFAYVQLKGHDKTWLGPVTLISILPLVQPAYIASKSQN